MDKDDPIMAFTEKLKDIIAVSRNVSLGSAVGCAQDADNTLQQPGFVTAAAKLEAYMEIACKIFPDTILRDVSRLLAPQVSALLTVCHIAVLLALNLLCERPLAHSQTVHSAHGSVPLPNLHFQYWSPNTIQLACQQSRWPNVHV